MHRPADGRTGPLRLRGLHPPDQRDNVIIADELGQIINEGRTTPAPVPLPASALLLVGAMAGLGSLRSVRRKEA